MSSSMMFADDHRVLALRNMQALACCSDLDQHPPDIVVGIALHNQAGHISQCLRSVFRQQINQKRLAVLILNDSSEDNWEEAAGELLRNPRVIIVDANCGSPTHSRNAILDYVDMNMPTVRWVARLDADDCFACSTSLEKAVALGERQQAGFVLGGNRLRLSEDNYLDRVNPATPDLLNPRWVLNCLTEMAYGTAVNELPSCNLILAAGAGWRYPDIKSAEDHALVADLLVNHADRGAILIEPFYSDYTLQGNTTKNNIQSNEHGAARLSLMRTVSAWLRSRSWPGDLLGYGREGVVKKVGGNVIKCFYKGKLTEEKVNWLKAVLVEPSVCLPSAEWFQNEGVWCCKYGYVLTTDAKDISEYEMREFLFECLRKKIVCLNIKASNFRRTTQGALLFIDVGNDIIPMNVDCFVDSAARLYCVFKLGWADDELRRRKTGPRTETTLKNIPGFQDFYRTLMVEYAQQQWATRCVPVIGAVKQGVLEVTLLIKTCAMDSETLIPQVRSIVHQLETPRCFHERILMVDPYRGPFLRQHTTGDYEDLIAKAACLKAAGVIDRILIAPTDPVEIAGINKRWFDISISASHSAKNVPVTSQLWAFDMIETRYVLQCDSDILIGRHDLEHDYLSDMLSAAQPDDVLGVAFNIAHSPESEFQPYSAPKGEFVPEVRCGLLDLQRMRLCQPLPNQIENGRLALTWYRSLQECQRHHGLRTLRGGDYRTFYIHPTNGQKTDTLRLAMIRDLVGQARVPMHQYEKWDLDDSSGQWCYAPRNERIVFLAKGRNTPLVRLQRFIASLMMQSDQRFGLVVIDDASEDQSAYLLPHLLKPLDGRSTLIRHSSRQGRIPNFIQAITGICTDPETLIVILDLDDALMDTSVVSRLHEEVDRGHDVILAAMFRPDKPVKCYHPIFENPRADWGGEVWIHLRAFKKHLFDSIPQDEFQMDGEWIEHCTDYATMIPVVECCRSPLYIPEYFYFHERSTPKTPELQARKDKIIRTILKRC